MTNTELVRRWQQTVRELEHGWDLELEDYLNDLDVRQELSLRKLTAAQQAKLAALDRRFEDATQASVCVYGPENERASGWTPATQPWFYRMPKTA